ncbi:MAG: hypothetical protein M1546_14330 [Chloroflexi bacterium]|nr:hypothetical protein [Chloroflexota bacterium]
MFGKLTRSLISLTAIVASTALAFGASTANAASNAEAAVTTAAGQAVVSVSMQQLNQRVATVPALASLKDGDRVIISDDGTVTGATWQGIYVYHPAGSTVTPSAMYARWKDGVVTITPTPAETEGDPLPGTLDAGYVTSDENINNGAPSQVLRKLITDTSDPSVLRIPDNAWLFRVNGSGQYTALVDVFVFESGSQPVWHQVNADDTTEDIAQGSQPVPVAAWYWQAQ